MLVFYLYNTATTNTNVSPAVTIPNHQLPPITEITVKPRPIIDGLYNLYCFKYVSVSWDVMNRNKGISCPGIRFFISRRYNLDV